MSLGMALLALSPVARSEVSSLEPQWGPHVDVEAKPGSKRTLSEADLFLPLVQDARTLVFGNLRTRFDNKNGYEGNLGIGMRRMVEDGWNLGAYGYWDHRRSSNGNFFDQATLGAEALGRDWEFRANGYVPVGTRAYTLGSDSVAALSGASVQVTTTTREERALKGYDLEAGWRVPIFDSEGAQQLRLYAGSYRFADAGLKVEGPRLRAELVLQDLPRFGKGAALFLGAEAQHDSPRGHQNFLSVRLRIPLGKETETTPARLLTAQQRRMTAPVVRDVDIVAQSRVVSTLVETGSASGGQAITVINSATTSGGGLQAALNGAGINSTVVLTGTFNTTARISMSAGQTIIGGGALSVQTPSGHTATLNLSGATIATAAGSAQSSLLMANNSTISGMTITNTYNAAGANGVDAQARTGASIINSVISVNSTSGVYAIDARGTNLVIRGNTITANATTFGASGIYAQGANNITVAGNTFESITTNVSKYAVAGDNTTSINSAASTGNVSISGTCAFSLGAPTGSIGFTTITCP